MNPDEPRRLNVLMVGTQQTRGGAGRIADLIARQLRRQGHSVNGFVRDNIDADPTCHEVRYWRVTPLMRWLRARGLTDLGNLTSFLWRCREAYAAADVIHLNNLHGDYLSIAALPLWGLDKPLVWMLHDGWPVTGNCAYPRECTRWLRTCGHCPQLGLYPQHDVDRSRFYRWLKPRLAAAARPVLIPSSNWLAGLVVQVPQLARLPRQVIPNPVVTEVFTPPEDIAAVRRGMGLDAHAPTVVLVGCLYSDPRKNAPDAIASVKQAAQQMAGLQVLAVAPSSKRFLAEAGLPGRALPFINNRAELAQAYACGDILLFPSRADNHPMTVIEAMACGTPVVAYNAGGIPDQIEHLRTGYMAEDGNVADLTEGIVRLLKNRERTHEMGERARDFVVRTCSVEVVARQVEEQYRRAIRTWRRRRQRTNTRSERSYLARRIAAVLDWDTRPAARSRPGPRRAPMPALGTGS